MTKSDKPTIRIHNTETGEVIDREMTAEELESFLAQRAKDETARNEVVATAEAKAALLAKLGITADEAALLLG
jgi:hypothetical protein